eukprot:6463831-Amphidinium_carterae.5
MAHNSVHNIVYNLHKLSCDNAQNLHCTIKFDNDDEYALSADMVTTLQEDSTTPHVHKTTNNTIAMIQKMNIKLPTPTQLDGKHPQFNEWAREVKAYPHDPQSDDITRFTTRLPAAPDEDANNYDENIDLTLNIRKKRDDITNFSQTLNYVFVHSTKPESEAHANCQEDNETNKWVKGMATVDVALCKWTSSSTILSTSQNYVTKLGLYNN